MTPDNIILLVILFFVVVIPLAWVALLYNDLVRTKNACAESWSDVDTELKRRYDLIPRLVEVVKGYAAHERGTLEAVIAARNQAVSSNGSPKSQARDEDGLVGEMRHLLAVVEAYPVLKADQQFCDLQRKLIETEDRIQAARRFYNANIRDMNNRVESIPSNIIASTFKFSKGEYFEIHSVVEREVPSVKL